jgi:hypothetical protein
MEAGFQNSMPRLVGPDPEGSCSNKKLQRFPVLWDHAGV